jgi:uncharacterized protein (TIGR03435 family)
MRALLVPSLLCAVVSAQTPAFDVVSIKRNTSGSQSVSVGGVPGRFTAVNVTALMLLQNAYPLETFHIFGAPGWTSSERYDVSATMTAPATFEQRQAMLRNMFAERFTLVSHFETRAMPAYVLTVARADGKLGPRIRPWTVDCKAVWSGEVSNPPPSSVPGIPPCGGRGGGGLYAQSGVNIEGFARSLASDLGARVIDRTGLQGLWEIHLQWNAGTRRFDGAEPDQFGSLFTSLQEQLGLKLESQRVPIDVLVIDSIDRPSEN